jgi:DNA mismatch endonuclease (patch repair protein)
VVDVVSKEKRSQMMSGIRSSNTKPEIHTRKALHRLGYRFRLDSKVAKIKPDIVLRSYKVAVFTHGCYWHQHEGCKLAYSDRDYSEKWKKKFQGNKLRDQRVLKQLSEEGWRIAVVWECATRDTKVFEKIINQLDDWIKTNKSQYFESEYRKT